VEAIELEDSIQEGLDQHGQRDKCNFIGSCLL
jgi:hypothetical protein